MRRVRVSFYLGGMQKTFRIVPLPTDVAEAARQSLADGAPAHQLVAAEAPRAYPCRHCLRWAEPGEKLVLFPYQSIPADRPYGERGPIFVHAENCAPYPATDRYPADFREGRVVRGYNARDEMIAAEPGEPEPILARLFADPAIAFAQIRSLTRGCFTMKVERAS